MINELLAILSDSHFEAYVGGPVAGVIAGVAFSALGQPNVTGSSSNASPTEALNEIAEQLKRIAGRQGEPARAQSNSTDSSAIFVLGLLLLVPLFLLVAYLPTVIQILRVAIATMAVFSITIALCSLFAGRWNTMSWWHHGLIPFLANVASFWIIDVSYRNTAAELINFAYGLLGSQPFSVHGVISAAINFYRSINPAYMQWMVLQMSAFFLVGLCTILVAFQSVHYVALANTRVSSRRLWAWLAWKTRAYASLGTTVLIVVLLVAGWAAGTGRLYAWTH